MKFILIPTVIVFCDQISKIIIKNYWLNNNLLYSKIDLVGNYVRLTFIENPGIAFGIDTSRFHIYVTCLTVIAIIILSYYLYSLIIHDSYEKLPWSFILGGAIGNCIDRIMVLIPSSNYLGVIDFIDIGINQYRWYTFNLADASITIGLIIYLFQTYISKNNSFEKNNKI